MWPTPTPFPTPGAPQYLGDFDVAQFGQDFAGGLISGFQFFDSQDIAGLIWFVLLAFVILAGLMSIRSHLENM